MSWFTNTASASGTRSSCRSRSPRFTTEREPSRGVGDVGIGWKRVLFSSRNSILSAQGELIMPTGNKDKGLGTGVTTIEAFAAYGQILPSEMFLQAQGGTEQPTSTDTTPRAPFGRVAFGKSFRQEGGLGRLWSPMIELLSDRDLADGAKTNFDLLPQFQVTLDRRQHIRVSAGYSCRSTTRRAARSSSCSISCGTGSTAVSDGGNDEPHGPLWRWR